MTSTTLRPKKSLPILDSLDDIRIASPCHADWDRMQAVSASDGARARFCGDCEKNVYDLSAMTRVDAMALIERHEGRCCVRFYQRDDGTVLTEDCPVGVRALLKRAERRALGGMAAGIGLAAAFVAFLVGGANPVSRRLVEVQQSVHEQIEKIPSPDPMPLMGAMPMPEPQKMGEIAVEPAPIERDHVKMGKVAAPPRVRMGDIAVPDAH